MTVRSFMEVPMPDMVLCERSDGGTITVPRDRLKFRPAAYGLVTHDDRILLVKLRTNGKYCVVGGGVRPGEPLIDGMRREVREESGLEVAAVAPFQFVEQFYYLAEYGSAWHGLAHYYGCRLVSPAEPLGPGDPHEGVPEWVPIDRLRHVELHSHAGTVVPAYLRSLGY